MLNCFNTLAALSFAALALSTAISRATVTLQFSQTGVARATGFANSASTPTNGMNWGIIIDSGGNGFQGGSYDVFASATSGFLTVGSVATDDYYVTTGLLTSTQTATGSDPGGAGGITSLANIFSVYPSGVGVGDVFRVAWFETNPNSSGTKYGLLADASFILPSDGATQSYAGSIAFNNGTSADPAKPTNLAFSGGPVPEPSRMILLCLGGMGFVLRRRRS